MNVTPRKQSRYWHRGTNLSAESATALREHQRALAFEAYLKGREEKLSSLDGYFTNIEELFFLEREHAHNPSLYDEVLLNIVRNNCASTLSIEVDPTYHSYIKKRAQQRIPFPPLLPREKTPLKHQIEKELVHREGTV